MGLSFDVAGARKAGYSDAEIADHLASKDKFDASGARKAGYTDVDIISHITGQQIDPPPSTSVGEIDPSMVEGFGTAFGAAAENLSRPNYAMAGGVEAALEGKPILPAMKKGFKMEERKVFGDVIAGQMEKHTPQFMAEHPNVSAAIQTAGGMAGDIFLDPTTYIGSIGKAVSKVPGIKQGLSGAKTLAKKALDLDVVQDVGKIVSNQAGPKVQREAYDVLSRYKNLQHYRSGEAIKEMSALDEKIVSIAKETGEDVHALRARIVDSVENRIMDENPTVNEIIGTLKDRNAAQLAKEQALGLKTGEVAMQYTDDEGFKGVDYFIHAITPDGKKWLEKNGGKEFRGISREMTDKHASMLQRKYGEMSVDDVNNYMRTQGVKGDFFMTDVARAQAIRDIRHARAVTGAEFYDEMAKNFSVTEGGVAVTPERLKGVMFDPEVAKVIDSHYKEFFNPEHTNRVVAAYDNIQNWWKAWTLGIFPAYHARNMAGNFWNNFLGGVSNPITYKTAMDIQRGAKGTLHTVLGDMSYDDVLRLAGERGVLGRGFYGGDIPGAIDDALAKGKWLTIGRDNKIVRTGMKVGTAIEENARLAHFISKLKSGMDADAAAKSVKKFLFDYTELTDIERNVFKRVFPFYSWSRKNLPLQLEMFVRSPGKQMIPIKFKHEIERLTAGDNPPPESNLAEWLKGDYAVRVSGRDEEGKFKYAPLSGYLPWGDIPRWVNAPGETAAFMTSPLIKEPLQQAANFDMYFRRPIATKELKQGVVFPGKDEEATRFMGVRLTPRTAHVLRNIRLLASIHRANPFQVFGESTMGQEELGTGQKLAQYMLGIRNYEVDEIDALVKGIYGEKRKLNDLQKELRLVTKELARAKDNQHIQDVNDRMGVIVDAINRIQTQEIPKHIRR